MADMSKRVRVIVLACALLVAAGVLLYMYSTPKTLVAAEDCDDKPKPKGEFSMAAECDAPAAPAPAAGAGS
jgi:hypothetical protein